MSVLTPSTVPEPGLVVRKQSLPDYAAYLHVAAAVIEDGSGRILIARRPQHLHQGGLWEFPGGKVEADETVYDALARELKEELGIQVTAAKPLIRIPYDYPDRKVLLDIMRVTAFENEPHGAEGQDIAWVERDALQDYEFPAANGPIVTAARLPHRYLITPEPGDATSWPAFLTQLEHVMENGIRLVQFRATTLDKKSYLELSQKVIALGKKKGSQVLLNSPPETAMALLADGVHLSASRLMSLKQRPLDTQHWVAASCHNMNELQHAQAIGLDFVVVSPVKRTASHPHAMPVGWSGFHYLTEHSRLPVFALGGMSEADLKDVWDNGGQGIAAIRSLWLDNESSGREC